MPRFRFKPAVLLAVLLVGLAAAQAAEIAPPGDRGLLKLAGHYVKWGPLAYGSPAEITYAYLQETRSFPGARNCAAMAPIATLLTPAGITFQSFDREIAAAFRLWSEAASLRFVRIDDADRADIVIGAQAGSAGVAFTNVVQKPAASGPIDGIGRSTICLDPSERWEIGIDGDPKTYNVRYVATHEIGHAIGLDHQGRDHGIMGFAYQEKVASPGAIRLAQSDIDAVVRLYGPAGDAVPVQAAAQPGEPCPAAAAANATALAAACEPAQKALPE
ncbi:matrixin family metalloprotease [Benzoatithermus flavus]|uniref:M57 family metalloprotease n=1 Tax=Benzoatithermus flavus TaxID=3108223 RepID=A0ABU8XR51_9PROT